MTRRSGSFGVFVVTIVVIGVAVAIGVAFSVPPSAAPFAILPLVLYHLFLWRRHRSGLSEADVDSIYYVGFLVTIAELAASVYVLISDPTAINQVLVRFAVGLVATGYAIVARLHVQSLSEGSEERTQATWEVHALRSGALLDTLETAILRLRTFSDTINRELGAAAGAIQSSIQKAGSDSVAAFESALQRSTSAAEASAQRVLGVLSDPILVAGPQNLRSAYSNLVNSTDSATASLLKLKEGTTLAASTAQVGAKSLEALGVSVVALQARVDLLIANQARIESVATNVEKATVAAARAADEAARAAANASDLVAASAPLGRSIADLALVLADAKSAVGELSESSRGLHKIVAPVSEASSALATLATNARSLESGFPRISEGMTALSSKASHLSEDLTALSQTTTQSIEESTAAVLRLAHGLSELAQLIIDKTAQKQAYGTTQ